LTSGETAQAWKRSITERRYVEGVQARAREYGYRVDMFWLNEPGLTGSRLSNIIWNRGIEGVIIAPLQGRLIGGPARKIDLDFDLFSAIALSETIEEPDLDRALHDQYTAMLLALKEMSALNYRTIGFVVDEELDLRVNHKWTAAYVYYRREVGRKRMLPPLIMSTVKQSTFDRWLDRYKPDAIVSIAHIGLDLLLARGLDIPGDIGYASLDIDGDMSAYPDVSGIDQQSELVGGAAVDMVVSAIQRGYRGIPVHPARTQIEGAWVSGKSAVRQPESPR
jgi:LacI family transcriptional regulator